MRDLSVAATRERVAHRIGTTLLSGAVAAAFLTVHAAPAWADADWKLSIPEYKIYDNDPWPFAGQCRASAEVEYNRFSHKLRVETRTTNTSAISACRVSIEMVLPITINGSVSDKDKLEANIATSCSTTDFSCTTQPQPGEAGRGWSISVNEMDLSEKYDQAVNDALEEGERRSAVRVTHEEFKIKRR